MKIKTEEKLVKQEITTYIADDGTIFPTAVDCRKYEFKQTMQNIINQAEQLRIPALDDLMPLTDGELNENNSFSWYSVRTEKDFNIINKAYRWQLNEPEQYPDIMCVESYSGYEDDAYEYYLSQIQDLTCRFWKQLGYKITLSKEKEIGELL